MQSDSVRSAALIAMPVSFVLSARTTQHRVITERPNEPVLQSRKQSDRPCADCHSDIHRNCFKPSRLLYLAHIDGRILTCIVLICPLVCIIRLGRPGSICRLQRALNCSDLGRFSVSSELLRCCKIRIYDSSFCNFHPPRVAVAPFSFHLGQD